jgi:hypothetical protein
MPSGRLVSGRGHRRRLRVSTATGSGHPAGVHWSDAATATTPAAPAGPALAELLAHVGHGRPLQRHRLLVGQPTELEALEVAATPGGDNRPARRLRVDADLGPGVGRPGAQLNGQVGQEDQLLGHPVGVAGQQLIQHGAVRLRHTRMQQRGGGDHQHPGRLGAGGVQA